MFSFLCADSTDLFSIIKQKNPNILQSFYISVVFPFSHVNCGGIFIAICLSFQFIFFLKNKQDTLKEQYPKGKLWRSFLE